MSGYELHFYLNGEPAMEKREKWSAIEQRAEMWFPGCGIFQRGNLREWEVKRYREVRGCDACIVETNVAPK